MSLMSMEEKIRVLSNRIPRLENEIIRIESLGLDSVIKEYLDVLNDTKKELSELEEKYEILKDEERKNRRLADDNCDYKFALKELKKLESMVNDMKKALEGKKVDVDLYNGFNNGDFFKLGRICKYFSNQDSAYISKVKY